MHRISRRRFLGHASSSALAVGLGAVSPQLFLNRTKAASGENPSEFIRVGLIGVGSRGLDHLRVLKSRVVAISDVDRTHSAKAKALLEQGNSRKIAEFPDYRRMLEGDVVDAVLISTPDHWHTLPAIHACQAGKDVYCEKPLTWCVAEGQALVKAVRQHKRVLQTGSQQRSDNKFRLAAEVVRSGRLGKVRTVKVGIAKVNFSGPPVADSEPPPELDYDFWLGPAPKRPFNTKRVHYLFRFFWDYSGGQVANWGSHHLDIANWALGFEHTGPVEISARARFHPEHWYEVPQWCEVTYRYADGTTVLCSEDFPMGCTFEGEKGTLYANRGTLEATPDELITVALTDTEVHLERSTDHHANWLACIKSRKDPIATVESGHRSASVCHLGNIAIRTGRTIRWDPAREEIIGDAEAAKFLTREGRPPWTLPVL